MQNVTGHNTKSTLISLAKCVLHGIVRCTSPECQHYHFKVLHPSASTHNSAENSLHHPPPRYACGNFTWFFVSCFRPTFHTATERQAITTHTRANTCSHNKNAPHSTQSINFRFENSQSFVIESANPPQREQTVCGADLLFWQCTAVRSRRYYMCTMIFMLPYTNALLRTGPQTARRNSSAEM